jgi:hypothetical protein
MLKALRYEASHLFLPATSKGIIKVNVSDSTQRTDSIPPE